MGIRETASSLGDLEGVSEDVTFELRAGQKETKEEGRAETQHSRREQHCQGPEEEGGIPEA